MKLFTIYTLLPKRIKIYTGILLGAYAIRKIKQLNLGIYSHGNILRSQYYDAGLYTIHVRESKDMSPTKFNDIVLVHGLGISSSYMVPLAKELSQWSRVYAVDLPGYGKSSKPKKTLTIPELSDSLYLWMETKKLKKAVFVGNSMGCQVIVDFAERYPEKVDKIVLNGPTVDEKQRSVIQKIFAFQRNTKYEPFSESIISLLDYWRAGLKRLIKGTQLVLHDKIEKKLPYIKAATLVIRGGKDAFVSQKWAEKVTQLLPHGSLITVPGKGHTVNVNSPKIFSNLVQEFLAIHRV